MLIELPIFWTILLNVAGWLAIQMGFAWIFTKMPATWFNPGRAFSWEHTGRCYEIVFHIKTWKNWLPDAARWFAGGFAKGSVANASREYLERFARETWRGELCHWAAMACAPVFFLWNPWWGDLINVAYALMANLPCLLVQRYNRTRLYRLLTKHSGESART